MSGHNSEKSLKATFSTWQQKANDRRQDAARQAGVASRESHEFKPGITKTKKKRSVVQSSINEPISQRANDSQEINPSEDPSKRSTRINRRTQSAAQPGQDFELNYHAPVKVRFNSTAQKPSRK
ncbi:hypothetical protein KR093_005673 [Drosophila rubida]|uniref:Uncharacterized protein n=1 Tax=Drosophila rubida TaxID=30044 RepID=A0AAD4JZS1_9MUSC|nr:hypothetical protein KR093_005673 [Drosophila rubida]